VAASEQMIANLVAHTRQLNCKEATNAKFLDLCAARNTRSAEFASERLIVESLMLTPRYAVAPATTDVDSDGDSCMKINLFGVSVVGDYSCDNEIDRYTVLHQLMKDTDIMQWWLTHKDEYLVLYKIAIVYLSIPVPSERTNSAAKRVFDGRESLGDNMFKAQMCTQSWLRLASALDFKLPSD